MAARQAASALENIINHPVNLSFSQVRLIKNSEEESVLAAVIDQPGTVVKLKYDGGLQGAAFLIFSNGQDQKLINGLVEQDASLGQTGETHEAIFNEIGNVLLNIYVGTIANQVNARVDYHVPHLFIHEDKKEWAAELISSHVPPQKLLLFKSSLGIGTMEIAAHIIIIMDYSNEVADKLC
jgi:chemotaxis protein CheY-P-specific phosphatase CheC